MVLSSLLCIVSAKMWLIVKIAVKFWIPSNLYISHLYLFTFFFICHCIILIGKQMYFVLAQGMYIMCKNYTLVIHISMFLFGSYLIYLN